MSFSFENQGFNTFLCYEIEADKEIDSLTIGMLTNNKIYGFAQTTFLQIDDKRYLKYNVSSKVSVKQYFDGIINRDRLLSIFSGITKAFLLADEYMINAKSVVLDTNYIFVNVTTSEIYLICLPVIDDIKNTNYKEFFKNILLNGRFDQNENGDYFAKLLNYLNSIDELVFEEFNELLVSLSSNRVLVNKVAAQVTSQSNNISGQGTVINPVNDYSHVNNVPVTTNNGVCGFNNPFVAQQPVAPAHNNPSSITTSSIPEIPGKDPDIQNPLVLYNDTTSNSISVPLATSEKKNKKAGGVFGFLHKEKKEKPQKGYKKDNNNKKTSSYSNVAIPGQIVPPTVKDVVPAIPIVKTEVASTVPHNPAPVASSVVANPVVKVTPAVKTVSATTNVVNFGETTVLGGGAAGETTVLNGEMSAVAIVPHIIRAKNNEKINVNKPVFRIGKEKSYVDYFVADNTAISRSHANIITREDRYFIVDTNSTNHTFVNGQMIPSNSEVEVVHGSKIRLANEDFEFRLY